VQQHFSNQSESNNNNNNENKHNKINSDVKSVPDLISSHLCQKICTKHTTDRRL